MMQVLRNFDGLISGAVTEQLVESGVKVMSHTQVRDFVFMLVTIMALFMCVAAVVSTNQYQL